MKSTNLQKRKYKRERSRRTKQIFERFLLTMCIMALLIIGSSALLTKASDADVNDEIYYKYYTQIEIQHGDSLWNIAGRYMENGSYQSRQEYMEEVIELNQLSSTKIIKGQHLIVPYFENTYK